MMEGAHSEATCQPAALGHTPIPLWASGSPRVTWVCYECLPLGSVLQNEYGDTVMTQEVA